MLVTSWWRGTLVWGVDGPTVNGDRGDFFFIHSGDIFSELGGGNDTLKLIFLRANSVDCNLGEGDDEMKIAWSWFSTLSATGGDGNDRAERRGARHEYPVGQLRVGYHRPLVAPMVLVVESGGTTFA